MYSTQESKLKLQNSNAQIRGKQRPSTTSVNTRSKPAFKCAKNCCDRNSKVNASKDCEAAAKDSHR